MAAPAAEGTSENAVVDQQPSISRRTAFVREASCHSSMLIAGWSDASSGPLIPYIQAYYGISYTVVSMLFVGQMVGFLAAALFNAHVSERFGLGKIIAIGGIVQACGYVFLIPAFPYPVMPICYAVIGFGMALQDAQANTYIASRPNSDYKFGLLHASYGLGALVVPLAATAFASSGLQFSHFYGLSLALSVLNLIVLLNAFRFSYRIPHVEPVAEEAYSSDEEIEMGAMGGAVDAKDASVEQSGSATPASVIPALPKKKRSTLMLTLTNRTVLISALFIFFYVGSEVSMGGWVVTFLQTERDGGASAGYVATGFWGGITLGRAIATPLNSYSGLKRVIFLYLVLATGLEFSIWFARSYIGNAVVVALVGVLLGPLYPIVMVVMSQLLPRSMHASGIGFAAAFGQVGSAVFPFITGALAQKFNPTVLHPVLIVLFVIQAAVWTLCPPLTKKKE